MISTFPAIATMASGSSEATADRSCRSLPFLLALHVEPGHLTSGEDNPLPSFRSIFCLIAANNERPALAARAAIGVGGAADGGAAAQTKSGSSLSGIVQALRQQRTRKRAVEREVRLQYGMDGRIGGGSGSSVEG